MQVPLPNSIWLVSNEGEKIRHKCTFRATMAGSDAAANKANNGGKNYTKKERQERAKKERRRVARAASAATAASATGPHSSSSPLTDVVAMGLAEAIGHIEMGDMDEGDQLMRIDEDCNSDED